MPKLDRSYSVPTRGVGTPDYASPAAVGQTPSGNVYASSDVSELATRLRPLDTLDRRGNIIFYDDFRDGMEKWVGVDADWSSVRSRSSGFSAFLNPAAPPVFASIAVRLPMLPLGVFGVSVTFNLPTAVGGRGIRIHPTYNSAKGNFSLQWYMDWAEFTLPAGNGVGFSPTGALANRIPYANEQWVVGAAAQEFCSLKHVVDLSNRTLLRFLVNGDERVWKVPVTLAGPTSLTADFLEVLIEVPYASYIDNVIVTQNEPLE
jgi:hypothetical protein